MEEPLSEDSIQELLDELEEESGALEPPPPDIEELLRELKSGDSAYIRGYAARRLRKVGTSSPQIMQALIATCKSDLDVEVRRFAAESLHAPVHQECLRQHPALMEAAESALRKTTHMRKSRPFSWDDIIVAAILVPISLFLLYLGLNASSEARRIASYPVLVGPGFEAMAPGEHVVIVGVLEGNAVLEHELVAFARERWDVYRDREGRSGYWHDLGTHVPGLAVSLDGAIVHTAGRDSDVRMEGIRHEAIYHRGSGVVYKGVTDGSRRVIGFKNGDRVTVVGEKDANGTLIPEILLGGELERLLSARRGAARFATPFGGVFLAAVPLAWLVMRLRRRIRAGSGKRGRQADPGRRARQAEIQRLSQEGLVISQPDLARELGVQSPTIRRWCKMLRLEPAHHAGRNYYTSEQADLIRRYGSADPVQRREILRET